MRDEFFRLLATTAIVISYSYADTIESAMAEAYKNNVEIKEKIAALRAANEEEVQAKSGFRPNVTLKTGVTRGDQNISGTYVEQTRRLGTGGATTKSGSTSNQFSAEFKQNIFQGGSTVYTIEQAKAKIEAARADLNATVQKMMFAAVKAYVDLYTATKNYDLQVASENSLKETLESAKSKFNLGEETKTNVADAQSRYADGIARRLSADAELEGAKATYEKVVGKKAGTLAKPTLPKNMPQQLVSAIDKAMNLNPFITKNIYEEIAARRGVDRANAGLLPSVDFTASSARSEALQSKKFARPPIPFRDLDQLLKERSNQTNNQIGVEATWKLYDGGTLRSQKRQAAQNAEQKRIGIEKARQEIREALTKIWEKYLAAKDSIVKREDQVKAREVVLEGMRQEQQVGSRNLTEVLDSQIRLLSAQMDHIKTQGDYYSSAYEIVQLTGELTPKKLSLNVEEYNPACDYENVRHKW